MTQNTLFINALYVLRKLLKKIGLVGKNIKSQDFTYVQYRDEDANKLVYDILSSGKPCMISKFGTVELGALVATLVSRQKLSKKIIQDFFNGYLDISVKHSLKTMGTNAGFFPATSDAINRFVDLMVNVIPEIDILGSYITRESYINHLLSRDCKKINLDGYYAPFLYNNPWTRILKGKKVLVIHPFTESIKSQYYDHRTELFENPLVLPEFASLETIKAVQTIGGKSDEFETWFEALSFMKRQIDQKDFDIALIGCGAYGMPLAAYVKKIGKQAIHLAGWTQMLFGIYGKRWLEDQPRYSSVINQSWIRPSSSETPESSKKVEGGCYW